MSKLDLYPFIKCWVMDVAYSNGMVNRESPEYLVIDQAESALFADGVVEAEVEALNTWLGTLTKDEFETLADGEMEEMTAIAARAPIVEEHPVSGLLKDIFEF